MTKITIRYVLLSIMTLVSIVLICLGISIIVVLMDFCEGWNTGSGQVTSCKIFGIEDLAELGYTFLWLSSISLGIPIILATFIGIICIVYWVSFVNKAATRRSKLSGKIGVILTMIATVFMMIPIAKVYTIMNGPIFYPIGDIDRSLLIAVQKGDLKKFSKLLGKGADPNTIFGPEPEDWVMCAATKKNRVEFLKLAVDYGGDINLRNSTPPLNSSNSSSLESTPLGCVAYSGDMPEFNFLMEKNVKVDIKNCLNCKPWFGNKELNIGPKSNTNTPIDTAQIFKKWQMIYQMIEKRGELRRLEINRLIHSIETIPIRKTSEENSWRLKVAQQLRDMGHKVTPDQGFSRIKAPKYGEPAVF